MGLTSFSAGFVSSSLLGTRGSFSKVPVGLATGVSRSLALISRDIRCATIMPTTSNRFRYWPCSPMHGLQSQAGTRQRLARGQLSEQAVVKQNGKASEPLQTTLQASRACDHSPPNPVHIPGTCECDTHSHQPLLCLLSCIRITRQASSMAVGQAPHAARMLVEPLQGLGHLNTTSRHQRLHKHTSPCRSLEVPENDAAVCGAAHALKPELPVRSPALFYSAPGVLAG